MFSTVSLEAILFNKPVILMNFSEKDNIVPFADNYGIIELKEKNKLVHSISNILKSSRQSFYSSINKRKIIKDFCYKFDGHSTDRIIKVIKKILLSHDI